MNAASNNHQANGVMRAAGDREYRSGGDELIARGGTDMGDCGGGDLDNDLDDDIDDDDRDDDRDDAGRRRRRRMTTTTTTTTTTTPAAAAATAEAATAAAAAEAGEGAVGDRESSLTGRPWTTLSVTPRQISARRSHEVLGRMVGAPRGPEASRQDAINKTTTHFSRTPVSAGIVSGPRGCIVEAPWPLGSPRG